MNPRELGEGHRVCVSFDEPTKQVVLTVRKQACSLEVVPQGPAKPAAADADKQVFNTDSAGERMGEILASNKKMESKLFLPMSEC